MTEPMDKLYGFKIVGFDHVSEFTRDVTVISVEVPNEWLERVMTRDQLDETHRRYAKTATDLDVQVLSHAVPIAKGTCNEGRAVLFNMQVGIIQHADDQTPCMGWVLTPAEAGQLSCDGS